MRRKPLYNWIADGVCLACIIATFVLILLRRSMLPEQIPTHFDLGGNVTAGKVNLCCTSCSFWIYCKYNCTFLSIAGKCFL